MILSTGMRTDIPAFYSDWFCHRLKEGYVMVRNPYNPSSVTKYLLNPDVVDVIGFCTKNPHPMLEYMNLLQDYGQYWFVTITPYGKDIEPNVPSKHQVIDDFITLSQIVGPEAMGWRYDPIFINEKYTVSYHIHAFTEIAKRLHKHTHTCVISFIDLYEKTKRNFPEVQEVTLAQQLYLGEQLCNIAKRYDMIVRPCAEGDFLSAFGADCSGCMTVPMYEATIHTKLNIPKTHLKSQRPICACMFGRDIGEYNTCAHFCKYCYANYDRETVLHNMKKHDPQSPFLIGYSRSDDVVHVAEQKSWKETQFSIYDFI